MFKKIYLTLALAGTLLFGSCSNDEILERGGADNNVTFNVQVPQTFASRAYSDGTTATQLTCYIYQKVNSNYVYVTEAEETLVDKQATILLNLIKGETYAAVFWAEADVENSPYSYDKENAKLTLDFDGIKSNDETRDAFYLRTEDFTVSGSVVNTVELTRPFAQINIGASDLSSAFAAGYIYKTAKVTAETYTTLDLLTGEADDLKEVTFDEEVFPTEAFPITEEGVTYQYLAMNYILTNDNKELRDITLSLVPDESSKFKNEKSFTYSNVPVQRNYRTNIYGTLFTDQVKYHVAIDQEYNTPDYNIAWQVYSVEDLKYAFNAANDGDIVSVNTDLDISDEGTMLVGSDVTITVPEGTAITTARQDNTANILVEEGTTVTVEGGGTLSGDNRIIDVDGTLIIDGVDFETSTKIRGSAITVNEGGELIFNDGTIEASYFALYVEGKVTINGGEIITKSVRSADASRSAYAVVMENSDCDLTINGGYFEGIHGVIGVDYGTLTINGGEFVCKKSDVNPADYFYSLYVYGEDCVININGGYFYGERNAICIDDSDVKDDSTAKSEYYFNGGYFNDQGYHTKDNSPVLAATGYEWSLLSNPYLLSTHGYELSLPYAIIKSE